MPIWVHLTNEKNVLFLNNKIDTMGQHDDGRLAAIIASVIGFVISLVFNGLSVVGVGKSACFVFN